MAELNRIKAVLAERGIMSKWLAKTLQKDPATVSKWCTNRAQPDLYTLAQIAEILNIDIHELICHTKQE
jgi:transcriptional regulator with XRE-family HTH domain